MNETSKISILKDVFTNTPHVIALSDESGVKVKALTEYGLSIIKEQNTTEDYKNWGIPDGFIKTEFKQLTPQMQQIFDSTFSDSGWSSTRISEITTKIVAHQKVKSFLDRTSNHTQNNSFKTPSSNALSKFKNKISKINIVNYKAKTFKDNATTSSLVERVKSSEVAFDSINNIFSAREGKTLASHKLEEIVSDSKNTRLLRRTVGEKINNFDISVKNAKRRAVRRAAAISKSQETKENSINGTQKFRTSIKSKFFNRKRFTK